MMHGTINIKCHSICAAFLCDLCSYVFLVAVIGGGGRRVLGALAHSRYLHHAVLEQGLRRRQPEHACAARIQNTQQFRRLSTKGEITPHTAHFPCLVMLIA